MGFLKTFFSSFYKNVKTCIFFISVDRCKDGHRYCDTIEAARAELVSIYNPDRHPKLRFPPSIRGIIPATKYCSPRVRLSEPCPKRETSASLCSFQLVFPHLGQNHVREKEMQMRSIIVQRAFQVAGSREGEFRVTQMLMVAGTITRTIK